MKRTSCHRKFYDYVYCNDNLDYDERDGCKYFRRLFLALLFYPLWKVGKFIENEYEAFWCNCLNGFFIFILSTLFVILFITPTIFFIKETSFPIWACVSFGILFWLILGLGFYFVKTVFKSIKDRACPILKWED